MTEDDGIKGLLVMFLLIALIGFGEGFVEWVVPILMGEAP